MKKIVILVLFGLIILPLAANLLENGSFENWSNEQLSGWNYNRKAVRHQRDGEIKHSGEFSLKLLPLKEGYYFLTAKGGKIEDFPIELIIKGAVRYENLKIGKQPDGKTYYPPFVGIWTNTVSGKNGFQIAAVKFAEGSRDWFTFERKVSRDEITTLLNRQKPDDHSVTWALRINLMAQPGTVWLDDIQLIDPTVKSGMKIILAPGASDIERYAGKELSEHLEKVTGRKFAICGITEYRQTEPAIILGAEAALKLKKFEPGLLENEEWIIKTMDKDLVITGGVPRGVIYGVYEFLEKHVSCAWLDFDTEVIPELPDWEVPQIDARGKPAMWRREVYSANSFAGDGKLKARNKENFGAGFSGIGPGMNVRFGSPRANHTFANYSEGWTDPTLFAVKRDGKSGGQMCLTNPRVHQLVLEKLRTYIKADRKENTNPLSWPVIYDISQNDGPGGECECENCWKIFEEEGAYSGVNLHFINIIANAIKEEYPDIFIRTFAYIYTQTPPRKIVAADNVIIQSCNSFLREPLLPGTKHGDIHIKWSKHTKNLAIWAYWQTYLGFFYPFTKNREDMQKEFKFCRDTGVVNYFAQYESLEQCSFSQLQWYLGVKLMQNPDLPLEPLVDIFMKGYYGAAAPVMLEYLDYLEKRQREVPYGASSGLWRYLDDEFYKVAETLLSKAESLVKDYPLYLRHVRYERIPVDLSMLILWSTLEKTVIMPERKNVIDRYESCMKDAISNIAGAKWKEKRINTKLKELSNEVELFRRLPASLPEQFKGMDIVDLHWKDFDPWGDYTSRCLVDDPEAVCGKAYRAPSVGPESLKRSKRSAVHYLPLTFGLYDSKGLKENNSSGNLMVGQIPQDEKYHWYKAGEIMVTPTSYLWVHWTWLMRFYFRKAVVDIIPPKVDVYFSMKLTGPTYVKGSKLPDNVFVDRVILVRK